MGSLFKKPSPIVIPAAPVAPVQSPQQQAPAPEQAPPPPPPPSVTNIATPGTTVVAGAGEMAKKTVRDRRKGLSSTVLAGEKGSIANENTLLGQIK